MCIYIYNYSLCTWINLQDAADGDLFLMDQQVPWTKVFRWSSNVRFLGRYMACGTLLLLIEEILHHLGWLKPYE